MPSQSPFFVETSGGAGHGKGVRVSVYRLDGVAVTLVLASGNAGAPVLGYIGPRLPAGEDLAAMVAAGTHGRHESQPDVPVPATIFPQSGSGWFGEPALLLRRGDRMVVRRSRPYRSRSTGWGCAFS